MKIHFKGKSGAQLKKIAIFIKDLIILKMNAQNIQIVERKKGKNKQCRKGNLQVIFLTTRKLRETITEKHAAKPNRK